MFSFRRYLMRYEADGESGLLDKRLEGRCARGQIQSSLHIVVRGRQKITPIFCRFVLGLKPGKAWLQTV
jgi:hypothetical protein